MICEVMVHESSRYRLFVRIPDIRDPESAADVIQKHRQLLFDAAGWSEECWISTKWSVGGTRYSVDDTRAHDYILTETGLSGICPDCTKDCIECRCAEELQQAELAELAEQDATGLSQGEIADKTNG
jgi:hypothetical protein